MKKTALSVGVNQYAGLPDSALSGCVPDCRNWSDELFSRDFRVTILTDHNAPRKEILNHLKVRTAELRRDDIFVFTNSSHGTWSVDQDGDEADRRDEAICPHDVKENGPISDDELYEIFSAKAPGSRIIFISDSCHSGTLFRFAPALAPAGAHVAKIRYMPPSVWLKPIDAHKVAARSILAPFKGKDRVGALVVAGCRDDEYSYDAWIDDKPCGAFTYAAIKALNEITANPRSSSSSSPGSSSSSSSPGAINYLTWLAAIRKRLPSVDYPQTPQLSGTSTQKRWPVLQ